MPPCLKSLSMKTFWGRRKTVGAFFPPPHLSLLPRVPLESEAPRGLLEALDCRAGGVHRVPPVPLVRRAPR